jgi:UDP-2,4-diacetamido-2,4,6-trideoxy-beta-L-altropyranose hydrolase
MVLDDLADRLHDCDLLLDPTLGRNVADYAGLIPKDASTLLGPHYALLRPEFAELRSVSLARRKNPTLKRLLITMGGVDNDNATEDVLDALDSALLPEDLHITVVMGPQAPWLHEVQARCTRMRNHTEIQIGVRNMARLMTDCDLAIGAAGGTSWERCCLGLPTIQFIVAENQAGIADQLSKLGAAICADSKSLPRVFSEMVEGVRSGKFAEQSRIASSVTDGFGAERVTANLMRWLQ